MNRLCQHPPSTLHVAAGGLAGPPSRHHSIQPSALQRYRWLQRNAEPAEPRQLVHSSAGREELPTFAVEAARLPNQADTVFSGTETAEDILLRMPVADAASKSVSDLDYLSVRAPPACVLHRKDGPMPPLCRLAVPPISLQRAQWGWLLAGISRVALVGTAATR
jgi:hypothetical protein